jgi:hypothetical protein
MTHVTRRRAFATLVLAFAAISAAACGSTTPSTTASTVQSAAPSPTPSEAPSATPATTSVPAATPSPSAAAACAVTPQTGRLPSDRFTDLKASAGATADRLTFVFGPSSLNSPAAPPQGSLDVAMPPYTRAGSGASIDLKGEHVVGIRFSEMSLQNDAGQEIYTGPSELKPELPALRQAVMYDASEGIIGWYVGYDGPGCVTLVTEGTNVTVTFAHP